MGTKNNPGKFDCYNKLEPDEPHFVVMGRDAVGWVAVLMWIGSRLEMATVQATPMSQEEIDKLLEARDCARAMYDWAKARGKTEIIEAFVKASPFGEVTQLFEMTDEEFLRGRSPTP